ncbi:MULTISPECIES: LacI family DNA-binding transcriptional regulator [Microbacterium]|jgi:DNA-binding LacI/PurR family transcriptional regulator|uniref:LacI family DNA-binding transcriptional regulator n=1 Tax=Microbacterium mcarthurae TaxID=3035918 RepID=A0ABW9GDY8_9MICO|nr:LacI family DNA-binding transcriptional regulator [Microbacterium sp. ACRRU]MCG7417396.1 LacI family transcriptional regulator [Microbacterium sp. ACRRU]
MSEADATRRPTVYDVAQEANVSIASVSFAFRRPDKLSDATRERVLEAARRLGYAPSAAARGLAHGRTGTLGLHAFDLLLERADPIAQANPLSGLATPRLDADGVIPWTQTDDDVLSDPRAFPLYVDEVQRGFELECWALGRPVMLSSGAGTDVSVADTAGRVDGLAIFPSPQTAPALARYAPTIPIVLFSAPPADDHHHRVRVDNAAGMRAVVEHLARAHGVRDVAFVGRPEASDTVERLSGLRAAATEFGVALRPDVVDATVRGEDELVPQLRALIAGARMPRALVCATDQHAFAVLDALAAEGIRVPDDVVVTGFDGTLAARLSSPPLTTVRQPMEAMGRAAARILAGAAGPADRPFDVVFEPRLTVRQSCGCRA